MPWWRLCVDQIGSKVDTGVRISDPNKMPAKVMRARIFKRGFGVYGTVGQGDHNFG